MEKFQSRERTIALASPLTSLAWATKIRERVVIEGFEADLARAIAEQLLGAPDRVDLFQVTDEQRIPALQSDLVEMVLCQITITPDRAEQVDFSVPLLDHARSDSRTSREAAYEASDDLKGKRLAVTAGSISMRRMRASLRGRNTGRYAFEFRKAWRRLRRARRMRLFSLDCLSG